MKKETKAAEIKELIDVFQYPDNTDVIGMFS
jgi:hypothetical protein